MDDRGLTDSLPYDEWLEVRRPTCAGAERAELTRFADSGCQGVAVSIRHRGREIGRCDRFEFNDPQDFRESRSCIGSRVDRREQSKIVPGAPSDCTGLLGLFARSFIERIEPEDSIAGVSAGRSADRRIP